RLSCVWWLLSLLVELLVRLRPLVPSVAGSAALFLLRLCSRAAAAAAAAAAAPAFSRLHAGTRRHNQCGMHAAGGGGACSALRDSDSTRRTRGAPDSTAQHARKPFRAGGQRRDSEKHTAGALAHTTPCSSTEVSSCVSFF